MCLIQAALAVKRVIGRGAGTGPARRPNSQEGDRKGGWAALRMPRPQLLGGATTP